MMPKMYDVMGIESPCMDFAVNLDRMPKPNESMMLNGYTWQGGGKVSSGMIAAARLGAKCLIMGTIGDDVFAKACRRDFARHGINTEYLIERKGCTTGFSVVLSDIETKGRSILHKRGTAAIIADKEINYELLKSTKYFFLSHLDGYNIQAAEIVRDSGGKVFMDADYMHPGIVENISLVDIFVASEFVYDDMFPNQKHDSAQFKANCEKVRASGAETVVFTFGEKGCVGLGNEGYFELPAFKVEVEDTLGAGDIFHGAFLAGLVRGWDAKTVARFASAVSAIKCTRSGGRAGIPDFDTVMKFLETGEIDYTEIDKRVEYYKRGLEDK